MHPVISHTGTSNRTNDENRILCEIFLRPRFFSRASFFKGIMPENPMRLHLMAVGGKSFCGFLGWVCCRSGQIVRAKPGVGPGAHF
jgi:hypothetical protein